MTASGDTLQNQNRSWQWHRTQVVEQALQSSRVAHIVAVDLNLKKLERLSKENPQRLFLVLGDVSQSSTSAKAVETATQQAGRVNSLMLNAAIVKRTGPFPTLTVADWRKPST
ncbi:uncharacterized protein PV06_11071 [Exophiala oligosperma]|uniref:Uncharacterized protein n=1 Tax=Exophiala oligosperma TaxID=215243 RepID=A0A0D2D3C4_9EURO|nr:uncharacterized protein PV06_11071 [Exophiala oligosperma]KIW36785.1 hypothetical protein PV06_11071 [Exophiala oligosperma]